MIYGRCSKLCEVKWFWFIRLPIKIHMTAFWFPKVFFTSFQAHSMAEMSSLVENIIVWKLIGPRAECNATMIVWRQRPTTTTAPFKEFSECDSVVSNWAGSKLPLKVSWSECVNVLQSEEFGSSRAAFRSQPLQERSRGREIGAIQVEGTRRPMFQ